MRDREICQCHIRKRANSIKRRWPNSVDNARYPPVREFEGCKTRTLTYSQVNREFHHRKMIHPVELVIGYASYEYLCDATNSPLAHYISLGVIRRRHHEPDTHESMELPPEF